MPKPQTQEEWNQYFNISIEVLFHSIEELEKKVKQLEKKKEEVSK